MKHKKILIIIVMFILVVVSIITFLYMNNETDITYQGTFVNCSFNKG